MATRFTGAPKKNEAKNPHTPVAQKAPSDETCFWNFGERELPKGAIMGGSAEAMYRMGLPTPVRVESRIVSDRESESNVRSVEGPQFPPSCVCRTAFRSRQYPADQNELYGAAFFRTTAWPAGRTPRYNCSRQQFNWVAGDPIEGILRTDSCEARAAEARNWWPITNLEWRSSRLIAYWAPDACQGGVANCSSSREREQYELS